MFAYCGNNPITGYDPLGSLDWGAFWEGASLLSIGLLACAVAATVVSGGACTPLIILAGATFVAGGVTVLNGTAEMIESTTEYNYMRDTVYGGDEQYYESQKEFFATIAETGTIMLSYVGGADISVCFIAGTTILAADGLRAIETIEKGDYVWAWDEESGDTALKEVVETYVNETDELVHIFVNDEEIVATPSHPFYSPVKGWTDAVQLRAGDILVLVNGKYVVVEKVQHEILEAPVTVYNFQVEDYHTYYVASGVLVHNKCGGETTATKRGREMHKDWDYGPGVLKEETIAPGSRVDGIDYVNKIIYELKPNNPQAIRRGLKQLDRYLSILGEQEWAGVLVMYD